MDFLPEFIATYIVVAIVVLLIVVAGPPRKKPQAQKKEWAVSQFPNEWNRGEK